MINECPSKEGDLVHIGSKGKWGITQNNHATLTARIAELEQENAKLLDEVTARRFTDDLPLKDRIKELDAELLADGVTMITHPPTAPPAESVEDAKALLPQQVEGADGWTPWIEPTNRHAYMVQCCGCDLVHKFQIIPVEGTRNGQGELTDFKELTDVPVILRATVSGAEPLSKTDKAIQEEADEFEAKGDAWDAFLMRKNPVEYSDSYAGFQFGWNAAIKWMKERRND